MSTPKRQCLTVEERLTALENMVLLLMTKHNRVARDWQNDSQQLWQCIRAIADLEPDNNPPPPRPARATLLTLPHVNPMKATLARRFCRGTAAEPRYTTVSLDSHGTSTSPSFDTPFRRPPSGSGWQSNSLPPGPAQMCRCGDEGRAAGEVVPLT